MKLHRISNDMCPVWNWRPTISRQVVPQSSKCNARVLAHVTITSATNKRAIFTLLEGIILSQKQDTELQGWCVLKQCKASSSLN